MLTGYQLTYNGYEDVRCYAAGTDAAIGLQLTTIPCGSEGGKLLGLEWAIPCSSNGGASITGFSFQRAVDATKPRADAVKTIVVQDSKNGGTYGRWIVPDSYVVGDFTAACCAGCDPLPSVTVTEPILFGGECTVAAPVLPGCVYKGGFYVPALTGANTTFTATGFGLDVDGNPVIFTPTTSTGTSIALLAADMTTDWATEMGSGTFTAVGNTIEWTGTIVAKFDVTIVQS